MLCCSLENCKVNFQQFPTPMYKVHKSIDILGTGYLDCPKTLMPSTLIWCSLRSGNLIMLPWKVLTFLRSIEESSVFRTITNFNDFRTCQELRYFFQVRLDQFQCKYPRCFKHNCSQPIPA